MITMISTFRLINLCRQFKNKNINNKSKNKKYQKKNLLNKTN